MVGTVTRAEIYEIVEALRTHVHRLTINKKIRRANTAHRLLEQIIADSKKKKPS